MYADEGYSAKIEESAGTITTEEVVSQTKDYKKNNIDLYFASGSAAILELVDASAQILRTSDYTLLEDLSDVYESGAIGFNKQVETESIESKYQIPQIIFLRTTEKSINGRERAFYINGRVRLPALYIIKKLSIHISAGKYLVQQTN